MAGDSPRQAIDATIENIRRAISCIGDAHVFGSGTAPDKPQSIAVRPHNAGYGGRLPLRAAKSGRIDLLLGMALEVEIIQGNRRREWNVRTIRYLFEIFDHAGREILLYHWHPAGASPIRFPHLHAAFAQPILLSSQHFAGKRELDIAKCHLPTQSILLEDVIELLIQDFAVEPLRHDWSSVLQQNREGLRIESR